MLTDLQRRIARIVLQGSPDPELALAGGAALIAVGLVERTTVDLDFFTTSPGVGATVDTIESALQRDGLDVERQQEATTFARLVVSAGEDRCQVDVAQDFRLLSPQTGDLGQMIASEELAADKVLALFARALARDFVDVYFLAKRFGKDRLLELANEKDLGFDRSVFASMLGGIGRLDRAEFEMDDATLADLQAFFAEWRAELA